MINPRCKCKVIAVVLCVCAYSAEPKITSGQRSFSAVVLCVCAYSAEPKITSGQRSISVQTTQMTSQRQSNWDIMSVTGQTQMAGNVPVLLSFLF